MIDTNELWMIAGVGVILGEWLVYTAMVAGKWAKQKRDQGNGVKEHELLNGDQ